MTITPEPAGTSGPTSARRELVSIGVVSRELGLSPSRIRQLVDAGELPAAEWTAGGHRRFDLAAVRDARARQQLRRSQMRSATVAIAPFWERTYPLNGTEEDRVWLDMVGDLALQGPANAAARYVVTEIVNNAVDHSGGSWVKISVRSDEDGHTTIEISDDGDGLFHHLATGLGLDGDLAALGELSKGKQTTDPDRHTGEGIFFSSKSVDVFAVEANGYRLTFDNVRDDFAAGMSAANIGTTVRVTIDPASTTTMQDVFARYTEDFMFSKTRPRIKLYELGVSFVSRSEAKRLVSGLETFREVDVDFANVDDVGQGFADELFRVWANAHPATELHPTGMNDAIAFMVNRSIVAQDAPQSMSGRVPAERPGPTT